MTRRCWQDAQELLRYVLDGVDTEESKRLRTLARAAAAVSSVEAGVAQVSLSQVCDDGLCASTAGGE
jgi:hypothetical protein